MQRKLWSILKYILFVSLAGGLLFYTFKEISFTQLVDNLKRANIYWLLLSICVALLSHVTRAFRWIILLEPLGYKPKLSNTFFAVMIGYFANLFVPRMGEVSRCAVLGKTDSVPVDTSFGTVITERLFDLMMLIILILLGMFLMTSFNLSGGIGGILILCGRLFLYPLLLFSIK